MRVFATAILLAVGLTLVAGVPTSQQRVVGGTITNIQTHPFSGALLRTVDFSNFVQSCGGTILNNRALLSAAHCLHGDAPVRWRVRIGSNLANSGGTVLNTNQLIIHPSYNVTTRDNDIAVIRTATNIVFSANVNSGSIAGAAYNLPDNAPVVAIGWGATAYQGPLSENLRQVQIWTVNQVTCRNRYAELGRLVTDNMLCSGWLDVGGRDQCTGDNGSPIIHGNVIVGVRSWGQGCGLARFPGVSSRVSRFTAWIVSNA